MENQGKKSKFKVTRKLIFSLSLIFAGLAVVFIYFLRDPSFSLFKASNSADSTYVEKTGSQENDYNKVANGIHLRTGLVDADGLMTVVNNCTNCHSAKLIVQNRMNEERWKATIKWMQETQNLWDLGENEQIIVDYLVTNYPPQEKGRRPNLENIEWYTLK